MERLKTDLYTANHQVTTMKNDMKLKNQQLQDARGSLNDYQVQNEKLIEQNGFLEEQVDKFLKKITRHEQIQANNVIQMQEMSAKMNLANDKVKSLSDQLNGNKRNMEQRSNSWVQEK